MPLLAFVMGPSLTGCAQGSTATPIASRLPVAGVYAAEVPDIHGLGPVRARISLVEVGGTIKGILIFHPRPGSALGPHIFADSVNITHVVDTAAGAEFAGSSNFGGVLGTLSFTGSIVGAQVTVKYHDNAGSGSFTLPLVSGYQPTYALREYVPSGSSRRNALDFGGPAPVTAAGTYQVNASGIPTWTSPTIAQAYTSYSPNVTTINSPCSLPNSGGTQQFSITLANPQPITNVGPWPYFPQYTYTGSMSGNWQYGASGASWNVPNSTSSYVEPQDWDGDFMMTAEVQVGTIQQPSYTSSYNGWQYQFSPTVNTPTGYYVNIQIDTDQGGLTGQVQTIPGINLTGTPSVQIGLIQTSWFAGNSPTVTGICTTQGNVTVTGPS